MRHHGSANRRNNGQLSDIESMQEAARLSREARDSSQPSEGQQAPEEPFVEVAGGEVLHQAGLEVELNPEVEGLPPAA